MKRDESKKTFSLDNIQAIDNGKVANSINQLLRRAVADCRDREQDNRPRVVKLAISITPTPSHEEPGDVKAEFGMECKLPSLRSAGYPMRATSDGVATFRPESPFDPNQAPLPYAGADDGAEEHDAAADEEVTS